MSDSGTLLEPSHSTNGSAAATAGGTPIAREPSTSLILRQSTLSDITLYDRITDIGTFIGNLADSIGKSGLFPGVVPAAADLIAVECVARKQTPLQLAQTFHIIQGRLSMRADATLAEFNRAGGKHVLLERTSERAAIELTWERKKYLFDITWEQASQEAWPYKGDGRTLKDNWKNPLGRRSMLWSRLVSDSVRAICPSVNCGRYTPEEISDFAAADAVEVMAQQEAAVQTAKAAEKVVDAAAEAGFVEAEFEVRREPQPAAGLQGDPLAEVKVVEAKVEEPPFEIKPIEVPAAAVASPIQQTLAEQAAAWPTRDLMKKELGEIKVGIPIVQADWLKLLGKYHVRTANDMTDEQMASLLMDVRPGFDLKKRNGDYRKWLDEQLGALATGGAAAGGAAGK